jgi:hypothetical protein
MKQIRSLLAGCAVLSAGLAYTEVSEAGKCLTNADPERGLAILSPYESPDPCYEEVGGNYKFRPYYPGYAPNRRCLLIYGGTTRYSRYGNTAFPDSPMTPGKDYGQFSGGSQDETGLMHLGGSGPSSQIPFQPYFPGGGDIIDRIQGRR